MTMALEDEFGEPAKTAESFVAELIGSSPIVRGEPSGPIDLHETVQDRKEAQIRQIEDRIYEQALGVLDGVIRFGEVDPQSPEPSQEMLDDFGGDLRAVERANRLARYALMPAKDAPVGITVAKAVAVGIAKARATEKAAPRSLNVAILNVSGGIQHERVLLEDE